MWTGLAYSDGVNHSKISAIADNPSETPSPCAGVNHSKISAIADKRK